MLGVLALNRRAELSGFTLIELSIVLVVIGLIVGGVLVGQDLIRAAAVRAQISQIEKFQTATNTFREKYGYLPGDIKDPDASSFGFVPRGASPGQGDGNGLLQNPGGGGGPVGLNGTMMSGENVTFWNDLSKAGMIEGSYTNCYETGMTNPGPSATGLTPSTTPQIDACLPDAKIGNGNYVYVWSQNGFNYFGLSGVSLLTSGGWMNSFLALTAQQANAIDQKIDDGSPIFGNVTAYYVSGGGTGWYAGIPVGWGPKLDYSFGGPFNFGYGGDSTTCFENRGIANAPDQYSIEVSNGSNVTCALSFRFQ